MITKVYVGHKFISINIIVTNRRGILIDPAVAEIEIYRVSQVDGSLSLALEVGMLGKLVLAKQNNETGFFGVAVDTDVLGEGEYVIKYHAETQGLNTSTTDNFSISSMEQPGIIIHK